MKQIEAVVDQFRLQEVRNALEDMGIEGYTESAIKCHQKGQIMKFRGATFMASIVEKVKIEIIAADDAVGGIIDTISAIAQAGCKEDCRIAIHPCL